MTEMKAPQEQEKSAARTPHDIFLTNLIANHILLFTALAASGKRYFELILLVPLISFLVLGYTFIRASRVKREDSEFVYIHWHIARRLSFLFAIVLVAVVSFAILGWASYHYLGVMKEAAYAFVAGFSFLPTLISVLVLIIVEMDVLNHARAGTLPAWAKRKYLGGD